MTWLDYSAIRQQISIRQVLQLLGQDMDIVATRWRGPCLVCGHPERSLSIQLSKNLWQCFKCHRSGNQLDLYAAITELPLHEATIDLCQKLKHATTITHSNDHQTRNQ